MCVKLKTITDRMVRTVEDVDVNGFLNELEHNLKQSREVFNEFDRLARPLTEDEWLTVQMKVTWKLEQ